MATETQPKRKRKKRRRPGRRYHIKGREIERGATSTFTPEIGRRICEALTDGMSLRAFSRIQGNPLTGMVYRWLQLDGEEFDTFRDNYVIARHAWSDHVAEDILEIADDASKDWKERADGRLEPNHELVLRSRLRVDARKWIISKFNPKKYGDRAIHEHTGAAGKPIQLGIPARDVLAALITAMADRASAKQDPAVIDVAPKVEPRLDTPDVGANNPDA